MKQELVKRVEGIINKIDANESEIILQLKKIVREYEMINYSNASSRILSLLYAGNLKSLNQNESVGLVKSGFADFDIKFGGFSLGEFVVLGGRPSMGKTQLLVNLCKNISKSTPVLYFTLGLSERMLTNRFMSSLANIPIDQIVQNNLSDHEKSKLSSLEKIAQEFHLYINDSEYDSISAFKAHCQEQIKSNDVKVIIVDCLQSIKSRIDGKKSNITASALG